MKITKLPPPKAATGRAFDLKHEIGIAHYKLRNLKEATEPCTK